MSKPTFLHYAFLAGAAFVAALILIGLLLGQADTLVRLGLEGRMFFIALIPLGLAVSAFLFGALKSYAAYKGQALGGMLELGGPVVAFFLVLLLGFWLAPDSAAFAVTVFAQRADLAGQPLASGRVVLILGGDPRAADIDRQGAAYFSGIPARFKGQEVAVRLEGAAGYEATQNSVELKAEGVVLPIRASQALFTGYILDALGRPVADARVGMAGHEAISADNGYFKLSVPGPEAENGASLQVLATGHSPWSGQAMAGGGEIRVTLE